MLGDRIRNLRKNKNITIQEMSDKTGLSIGYISQVERNLVDPSLSSLRKISSTLGVPIYLLMDFDSNNEDELTVKKSDVLIMKQPNSTVEYHFLTPMPNDNYVPKSLVVRFKLNPNSSDSKIPIIHENEEIIIVEKGSLNIHIGNEVINLSEGDTTIIKENIPHIIHNPNDTLAIGMSIFTPAFWKSPFQK